MALNKSTASAYMAPPKRPVKKQSLQKNARQINNILTCVPPEMLREIIMNLDHYSLRALLLAYNKQIKDYFLLISDSVHPTAPPEFFKGIDLKRVRMKDFDPVKNAHQSPLIKLFEYVDFWDSQTSWILTHKKQNRKCKINPFMDEYSFVFVSRELCGDVGLSRTYLVSLTGANVLHDLVGIETPECIFGPSGSDNSSNKNNGQIALSGPSDWLYLNHRFKGLRSLVVQYVNQVDNLHLDRLEQLTIFFSADHIRGNRQGIVSEIGYPTIRKLKAPSLRRFAVFYHDQFPIMENIDVGVNNTLPNAPDETFRNRSMVRLIQVEATKRHITKPLPLPYSKCIESTDLSFTRNFASLNVIGGSDILIGLLDLSRCFEFTWVQANTQLNDEVRITDLEAPKLVRFSFVTRLDNAIIPTIHTKKSSQLVVISICTFGLGLNLNGIVRKSSKTLLNLAVQCFGFPNPTESSEDQEMPVVLDLRDFESNFCSARTISIEGYCLVLCDNNNDTDWLKKRLVSRGVYCTLLYYEIKGPTFRSLVPSKNSSMPRPASFRGCNRELPY